MNGKERKYTWTNTNRLLGKGFNGIKTGWTPAAGSCLAASYEKDGMFLVIIVVACSPIDIRWTEVPMLTLWAVNRLEKMMEFFSTDKKAPIEEKEKPVFVNLVKTPSAAGKKRKVNR